jgi:Ring finger domain
MKKTESTEDIDAQPSPTSTLSNSDDSQQLEPCSICLTEYNDGDEICWSHNDKCNHFFHKACIQTWLLTHEECPCCRRDFLCLWDEEAENNNQSPRQRTISDQSSFDWAEELAEEIQQRIFQRQRQLQAELERRDREQQQSQQLLHSASFPTSPNARTQPGFATRNTIISVDDMAAGFLLYRHFPLQFASDPRRLALGQLDLERIEDGGDVEVAHFGLPLHGSWQASRTGQTAGEVNPGTSVFDFVDRSSRPRRLSPGEHQPNRFFSTGTLDTSRRFFSRAARSAGNSPSGSNISDDRATAENSTVGQTNALTISRRFFGRDPTRSASNSPTGGNISTHQTSSENPTAEETSDTVASSGIDDPEIVTYTA